MTRVNFYLLKQNSEQARGALACRLAEQQAKQGQQVYILTGSPEQAQDMDQLLWSFTPESFVPHVLAGAAAAPQTRITIGHDTQAPAGTTCVLNLGSEPPLSQPGLAAIAEFVLNDDGAKTRSRVLWGIYKQLGYELQHHQL
jgi:DNA polymerase-3 subunit chi